MSTDDGSVVISGSRSYTKSSIFSTVAVEDLGLSYDTISKDSVFDNDQHIDVFGVRITPSVVTFANTFENQSYTETVSVQNISKSSVTIRIHNPRAWSFRLTPLERGYLLAPGLKITRRLLYTSTKTGIVHSSVPIYINEKCFELPLEASKGRAFVEIVPTSINFGRMDLGSKPVEKQLVIHNVSSCATKFLVDLGRNELDLQVSPLKGWIRPHSSVTINLQLIALQVGELTSEIWITTDLCQTRINVEVQACKRSLVAFHPNSTSDFTLMQFPLTFYGCRHYQTVVVYNMAAASSAFVVLADFGNQKHEPFAEAKKSNNNKSIQMFNIEPVEGRIRPFEGQIFTVWFQPLSHGEPELGWKSKGIEVARDYLCAVRIKRIQVDDFGEKINKKSDGDIKPQMPNKVTRKHSIPNMDMLMTSEMPKKLTQISAIDDISVLFCLYGEAELAMLTVEPQSIHFSTSVGLSEEKVVHFTNNSSNTLAFRYIKKPFFEVSPAFKKVQPKTCCNVTITHRSRNLGKIQKEITFEVLAESNITDSTEFQVVSLLHLKIYGSDKSQAIVPQPKFNPGITPMITHEVGFLTDNVTFLSAVAKPRAAMVSVNNQGRPWMVTDATIAFPNDRPLTLRPRPTDITAKTIFKGIDRYVAPVDETVTYTVEQMLQKKAHKDWFQAYIRGTAALSIRQDHCQEPKYKYEADPPIILEEKPLNIPRDVLVPLTFIQLYYIKVYPSLISFGSVTTSKNCTQLLTIDNQNPFNISAKVLPVASGIQIQTLDHFVVPAKSETKVMLTFHRETLGHYTGTVTCVINGYHSFDMAVVAEVVPKSLSISPNRVEFKLPEVPFAPCFVALAINNPLNTPVSFSWAMPDHSPFKVEPVVGVTPKKGRVWCAAYFEPDSPNYKMHPLELVVEGVMGLKIKSGVVLPKPNVYFLEPVMSIGWLPLRLPTVKRFVAFNSDYSDAMFVILNREPFKGITVEPHSGIIKARSCFALTLHISISSEGPLEFTVYMNIQNSLTIDLKVTGVLVYPHVEITPKYISLTRVPCNSITRTSLVAENKSKARAEVSFNMEDYSQFKVSLSKRHHDPEVSTKGFSLEPGCAQKFYLQFIPRDLASYEFYLPVIINCLVGRQFFSSKDLETNAKKVKNFYRSASLSERKATLTNTGQKATISHMVLIDVVVLKPILSFSDLELVFSMLDSKKNFTVRNISDEPVNVLYRCEDQQPAFTFDFDDKAGQLTKDRISIRPPVMPGESVTLTVTFTGNVPGNYVTDLSIMLSQQDHSAVYNSVRMTAYVSPACVMHPSTADVYFFQVPLGVDISYNLHLTVVSHKSKSDISVHYETTNTNASLFKVEFPKGNTCPSGTRGTVLVKLTFASLQPISVKKEILFKGSEGGECSVNVYATSDNCILTTHAFLRSHTLTTQTLKDKEDSIDKTESDLLLAADKNILQRNQQMFRPKVSLDKVSSSGSSNNSFMSLFATPSIQGKPPLHPSKFGSIKESPLSNNIASDMELLIRLNDPEIKTYDTKSDSTPVAAVTKEGEESIFPMFPMEPAVTEFAVHMNHTRYAVEQWVYEQVFNCSYYPILGSHTFSTFVHTNKGYGRCPPVAIRNVFDALERICGRNVRRYFTPLDKLPEDKNEKVLFTHNVYKQLLEFMAVQGALLSHVEPKYLLGYDDYCVYCKLQPSTNRSLDTSINESRCSEDFNSELSSPDNFKSISVQCWLDLFLQIFRTLVLGPTVGMKVGALPQEVSKRLTLYTYEGELKHTVYSRAEETLLAWLTHHYNSLRSVVWPQQPPAARTVVNFDADLEDGLVLSGVTAAFCPYLMAIHFQDMFLQPTTVSQAYHNVVCLTCAWDHIKLGFSVSPRDFVRPNMVKMLMLVTHLYRILPSYKPESTIKFTATLNSNETQIVTLENVEDSPITYHIEVLPNTNSFVIDNHKDTFVLKRKQTEEIVVRYTARNAAKSDATLMLCGACMPPKFGRNYVFKLEGYPTKLPVSSIFDIVSPLNNASITNLTIDTPHNVDVKPGEKIIYDIWITDTEPQPDNLNALCWAKERKRKIPRRLFILSEKLTVDCGKRQKAGQLSIQVCCFSQAVHSYWLLFMNPDIGDFIVKLQISPSHPEPSLVLRAVFDSKALCSCEGKVGFACGRCASVDVPCRNLDQWSAVKTMFELTISPSEKEFWATYIESNIGFRLLQWMLEEKKERLNREIELIFKQSKTYRVSCKSHHVTCRPLLHVPDVRAKTSIPIELHLASETRNHSTVLTLTSSDGQEIRTYTLNVISKN